ncbi:MAG: hypothetical protein JO199_02495, partial [Candidatus Eremiobacteraeota bacterium]|nr:hypothetical protein [Candidatus Eremiobacteraeota bacterium]
RVHVPWSLAPAPGPSSRSLSAALPPVFAPFATPTPFAPPTPGQLATPLPGAANYPIQALTLNLSGPTPSTQTMLLTPGSPGCSPASVAGGSVCQSVLSLAPGNYTAAVATYSSPAISSAAQTAPAQTIAFSVASTSGSIVNLAVGTVPQGVNVVPASATSATNAQGGVDLFGAGKHQLLVELQDANDNVIVGTGAPLFSVTQVGGALPLTIVQPTESSPNTFTVSPPGTFASGNATLRLTAGFTGGGGNPCMQAAATCSGTVPVDQRQLLAVANSSANTVTFYAAGQVWPLATIQNGVTDPQSLVFDGAGDVFVANQPGSISEYAPPYGGFPTTIGSGVNHPQALAVDARGNLFVANGNGSNTVTEYAPPYTGAPTVTVTNGIDDPVGIALDYSGNLYVVNQAANTVTMYAPPYNDAPTTISNGLNGPGSIAIDSRGNLFVSNLNSTPNAVLQYSPPYSNRSIPVSWITNGVNEQGAIGIGPSASLFVPNQGANTVTEYAAPYGGSPTVISGGQSQPVALAIDPLGNLYVANYGNNTVTLYPPPYNGSWTTIANGVSNPQALALSPSISIAGGAFAPLH